MGLHLPHPNGIIIGKGVVLGNNVTIYQQVTFGGRKRGETSDDEGYPIVKDNCVFYAGCKIIGSITVEDNTSVGANSVLNSSTDGGVYVGMPAYKVIKGDSNV